LALCKAEYSARLSDIMFEPSTSAPTTRMLIAPDGPPHFDKLRCHHLIRLRGDRRCMGARPCLGMFRGHERRGLWNVDHFPRRDRVERTIRGRGRFNING
jgi:hypothetical protein